MATYNRRGHYRRGRNGQLVWVSGHSVTRDGGRSYTSIYSNPKTSYEYQAPPKTLPKIPIPSLRSQRWAKPNSTCPICGAAVYFYSNEAGSRVYFDEIGPPWPKHPCMDNVASVDQKAHQENSRSMPSPYGFAKGRHLLLNPEEVDQRTSRTASKFPQRATPAAFIVQSSVRIAGGTLIGLQRLFELPSPEFWDTLEEVSLAPGLMVFIHEGWLTYFDMERGEVVRFWVKFRPTPLAETTKYSTAPQIIDPLGPAQNSPLPQSKSSFLQRLKSMFRG